MRGLTGSGRRDSMEKLRNPSRRMFFRIAGASGVAYGLPVAARAQAPQAGTPAPYAFFTAAEAGFIEAAVARLIPRDELGPGALEAGVPRYIDAQLAGAWGSGAGLYRAGPWREGTESQGYQLPFTPAEMFRHAIRAIGRDLAGRGGFGRLDAAAQDAYLRSLEAGEVALEPVPAKTFFDALLQATREGFFCDPVHGGNAGMVGWKLVGFPGAYSNFYDVVDLRGPAFRAEPIGLSEGAGHAHGQGG
jgi:gluconate 2-dehydrogenase gamma chain